MADMEFQGMPKIARLSRPIIITEKIDGTNGQIAITEDGELFVGSKSRWLSPEQDNHGFYKWVMERKDEVIARLGPGRHFGEFWGAGIQRRYGLTEKRFSLFNTTRWQDADLPEGISVVPVLNELAVFSTALIDMTLADLATGGSLAAPCFMKPEGVVVFHVAGNYLFKKTIEHDELPKGVTIDG